MRQLRVFGLLLIGLCSLPACDRGDILEIIGEVRPGDGAAVPGSERIPFEVFSDEVGDLANIERRVLLKTADAYKTFFGHVAPAAVDFSREWVIFYSAGRRPSTGFEASVRALARAGARLHAVTQLQSPGRTCIVGDAITTPHVLVKFRAQPETTSIDFSRVDSTVDCSPTTNPCAAILCRAGTHCVVLESFPPQARCVPNEPTPDPCATVRCAAGTHCEARPVTCVRAPCPPVAECVPDGPFCGGIAGIRCPGSGTCVDNPNDSCDPRRGGADCGGICACKVIADCSAPTVWDGSPGVCACVTPKDPPAGEKCGSNTCAAGDYCCNPSCGICAPKGGACIQIHCG
jgi:PrcB C-terminal